MTTAPTTSPALTADPLQLIDVDHVRFYVGNAKQAAYFYAHTFGFRIDQIADLTTGSREEADYLLTQGNIRILLTTPLTKDHEAAEEIKLYGDGIKEVALTVEDAQATYDKAISNGAESAQAPAHQREHPALLHRDARSAESLAAEAGCPHRQRGKSRR